MRGLRAFASSWALSTSTGAEEGGQGVVGGFLCSWRVFGLQGSQWNIEFANDT